MKTKTAAPKKKRQISVRHGVMLGFLLFTALVILLLWLTEAVFLESIYKGIKTYETKKAAALLTRHLSQADLAERTEEIAVRSDMCIMILRVRNENIAVEVASADVRDDCVLHHTDRSSKFVLYDAAREAGGAVTQRYRYDPARRAFVSIDETVDSSIGNNRESIIYASIATGSDGSNYLLLIDAQVTPVASTVSTLKFLLLCLTVVLIAFAALLTFWIARRLTRPIERLNDAAMRLAHRDYEIHADGSGYRETAALADTLNYAAHELSRVDELCRDLIANISHDLRTPLTMISGYAEAMRDLPGENTPENAQIIMDETERLTSLVNDVLDLSRFQSGTMELRNEPFALTDAVRRVLSRYHKLIERGGYTVTFEADRAVTVCSDETRFMQALYNLVNNAFTYTGADRTVRVMQTVTDGRVRISVTDTGAGIPADQLPLIWNRYYRASIRGNSGDTHRRAPVGTGLGLSIVREVMESLGGSYGVTSQVGVGSTFWIELPIIE